MDNRQLIPDDVCRWEAYQPARGPAGSDKKQAADDVQWDALSKTDGRDACGKQCETGDRKERGEGGARVD